MINIVEKSGWELPQLSELDTGDLFKSDGNIYIKVVESHTIGLGLKLNCINLENGNYTYVDPGCSVGKVKKATLEVEP